MFVCLCKGITHKQISDLLEQGAESVEKLQKLCGAGTDCGACQVKLDKMVTAQPAQMVPKNARAEK